MTTERRYLGLTLFCWLAGACDAATGVLLVAEPWVVLRLLRLAPQPPDPIYLRFVGVFVAGVGLVYLYPWLCGRSLRWTRVVNVLEVTAGIRLAVGVFVLTSVVGSALSPSWLVVAATDLGVAGAQLALLQTRWRRPRAGDVAA